MLSSAPFLLRRVVAGVLVGVALLAAGFFGWTRYRAAQYHHREAAVVTRYQQVYTACVVERTAPTVCAQRARSACLADPFWQVGEPFDLGLDAALPDSAVRCMIGPTG